MRDEPTHYKIKNMKTIEQFYNEIECIGLSIDFNPEKKEFWLWFNGKLMKTAKTQRGLEKERNRLIEKYDLK